MNKTSNKALILREPYFKQVSLENSQVFCIDDRYSDRDIYIKVPGGIAFFYNNLALMRRLENPDDDSNRSSVAKEIVNDVLASGLKFGVHSDDTHDPKKAIDLESKNENIGCGYIAKRQAIATNISQSGSSLKDELLNLLPEIFSDVSDDTFEKIINANKALIDGNYFNISPREVARTVIKAGAPSMVVEGKHAADAIAIINLRPNTTFDTAAAARDGLYTYNYDAWAFSEAITKLPKLKAYDSQTQQLSALVDFLATSQLLEVKEVYVRR